MAVGDDMDSTSRRQFLKKITLGTVGATLSGFISSFSPGKSERSDVIHRIAFGSCANQNEPQPIWDSIIKNNPDLFLFLGDNIYGDTNDMSLMREKYRKLGQKPGYQKLLDTCTILSTWDDHDYGKNDAGVEYVKKEESKEVFMDFFDVPLDSPRRKRPGIYFSRIYGPPGKRVQIILLDTRYFKNTSGRKRNTASEEEKRQQNIVGWYLPSEDSSAALLGNEQWNWLENQLQKEADFRIIGSSIQVVPDEKGMECWGNYPHERKRLFNLIEKTKANGVLFISGDVHFSEISVTDEGAYSICDFTSSGMTHSNEVWSRAVNRYRIGESYAGRNSGLINIDWNSENPTLQLQTISVNGDIVLEHTIKQNQLKLL